MDDPMAKVEAEVSAELVRAVLEAVCERDGISLESSAEPGAPARNYELAVRLKIGKVFGLREEDTTMGEWNITIAGHGIHDNGRDDDADAIMARFVEELRKSQEVKSAVFTVGVAREIGVPAVTHG